MRKLIAWEMITLDGYFAGPNGELDWHVVDEEFHRYAIDMLNSADLLIFGRVTYDLMASYWPTEHARTTDPVVAGKMNDLPKVVLSQEALAMKWQPTQLLTKIDPEDISRWKQQPGKDLVILGSGSLVQALTDLNLIDEYRLIVSPIVLGSGKPLFKDVNKRKLKLQKVVELQSSNVLLYYVPAEL
jgi:dihydrofolate reductase